MRSWRRGGLRVDYFKLKIFSLILFHIYIYIYDSAISFKLRLVRFVIFWFNAFFDYS